MKSTVIIAFLLVFVCANQDLPLPPFLNEASPEIIKQFRNIIQHASSETDMEFEKELDDWVLRQNPKIQSSYNEYTKQLKAEAIEAEESHKKDMSQLSAAAKQADQQLSAIALNPSLTGDQKYDQIQALFGGLPQSVQDELKKAGE